MGIIALDLFNPNMEWDGGDKIAMYLYFPRHYCQRQVSQTQEARLQFYQGWIAAVASHCFPHPTGQFREKIWKDPRGTNEEVRIVNLANWALRTSPKFTTGVKYNLEYMTRKLKEVPRYIINGRGKTGTIWTEERREKHKERIREIWEER